MELDNSSNLFENVNSVNSYLLHSKTCMTLFKMFWLFLTLIWEKKPKKKYLIVFHRRTFVWRPPTKRPNMLHAISAPLCDVHYSETFALYTKHVMKHLHYTNVWKLAF